MDDKRGSAHLPLPICTVGASGHGKTTLTAAIAKSLQESVLSLLKLTRLMNNGYLITILYGKG